MVYCVLASASKHINTKLKLEKAAWVRSKTRTEELKTIYETKQVRCRVLV
jgi:hypothetical protein